VAYHGSFLNPQPKENIMSIDQARAFIVKIKTDEAFRDRIMAIEDVDDRIAAASGAGFEFTEAEVKEVQSELSDEDMDAAAGGKNMYWGLLTTSWC